MTSSSASQLLEIGIYQYLQEKGYKKTLKKFLKESTDLNSDDSLKVILTANEVEQPPVDQLEKKSKKQKTDRKQETDNSDTLQKAANSTTEKKPFQRVDPTKVEFLDERLRTNDYLESKPSSYGDKAYAALAPTKGADFRKEKNKKKKGTYKGGQINTSTVHSIKFSNSSDDE